jgi:hypothetical protein
MPPDAILAALDDSGWHRRPNLCINAARAIVMNSALASGPSFAKVEITKMAPFVAIADYRTIGFATPNES